MLKYTSVAGYKHQQAWDAKGTMQKYKPIAANYISSEPYITDRSTSSMGVWCLLHNHQKLIIYFDQKVHPIGRFVY